MAGNENKGRVIQQEVEDILRSVAKLEKIKNYEVYADVKLGKGEGFQSEFFTGAVINKENGKKIHVAIKKAPVDAFSFEFGLDAPYQNENHLYSKLFPELDKFQRENGVEQPFDNLPRYLGGSVEAGKMYVAMENLKAAGYVLPEMEIYTDQEQFEFIFKIYGKLHGLSYTFKQKYPERFENLTCNLNNIVERFSDIVYLISIMADLYEIVLKTFDSITEADTLAKLRKVQDIRKTFEEVQVYKGNHKCLRHGDCWSNNMLMKYKETGELEDIKLIDWQCTWHGSPIHDLSYIFYTGASKEDMDKLDYYLDVYYESFSNIAKELGGNPEEMFPKEVLKKEWREYALWGLLIGVYLWGTKLMDKKIIENILKKNNLSISEYWELFRVKIIEVGNGEEYKKRARNICIHAVEYGIL